MKKFLVWSAVLLVIVVLSLWPTLSSPKKDGPTGPITVIVRPGTGILDMEERIPGHATWSVRPMSGPPVELGAIDGQSSISTVRFSDALGSEQVAVTMDELKNRYRGRLVTVIARVEAMVDDDEVLRVFRTTHLSIFLHADGLQQ